MDEMPPPTIQVIAASIANGRCLNARIDRDLKDLGLTWGRFHALVVMDGSNGWIHAGALGRKMGISRQSAHALLASLDERGSLRWMNDSWVHSARLTTDGVQMLMIAYEALGDTFAAIERVEVRDRKTLVAAEYAVKRELLRPVRRRPWYTDHLPNGGP
jgi:DNA-binding MarR family transcriptional regulator